jgi:hypothetical protein
MNSTRMPLSKDGSNMDMAGAYGWSSAVQDSITKRREP